MIDPPVSILNSEDEILEWIAELKRKPYSEDVRFEIEQAEQWIEFKQYVNSPFNTENEILEHINYLKSKPGTKERNAEIKQAERWLKFKRNENAPIQLKGNKDAN